MGLRQKRPPKLFTLGEVTHSPRAIRQLVRHRVSAQILLEKHQTGQWQEEGEAVRAHNEFAVHNGLPVASQFQLGDGQSILIMTTPDRRKTYVLTPEEYAPVELDLRSGYARWAEKYDSWQNPLLAVEEPHIKIMLRRLQFESVLDVGAGTGRYTRWLSDKRKQVIGLDLSSAMLAVARRKPAQFSLAWADSSKKLTLIQADAGKTLPFPAGHFDLVLSTLLLQHVADLPALFREFARLQKPGGYCLVSALHPQALAAGWQPTLADARGMYRLPHHAHQPADYQEAAESAGYQVVEMLELPVAYAPARFFSPPIFEQHSETNLCLIMLAQSSTSSGPLGQI